MQMFDFQTIFEEIPEAIILIDRNNGVILYANSFFEKLSGIPKKLLTGRKYNELYTEGEEFLKDWNKSPEPVEKHRIGYLQHSSGRRIPVEITARTVEKYGDNYLIMVFLDMRKLKKLERKTLVLNELLLHSELEFGTGSFQCYYKSYNPFFFISEGAKKVFGWKKHYIRYRDLLGKVANKDTFSYVFLELLGDKSKKEEILHRDWEFVFHLEEEKNLIFRFLFFNRNYVYGILKDTTKEKRFLQLIDRKNQFFLMLSQCNKVIAYSQEEEELFRNITKVIVETGGYELAAVGLKNYNEEYELKYGGVSVKHEDIGSLLDKYKTWKNEQRDDPVTKVCYENRMEVQELDHHDRKLVVAFLPVVIQNRVDGILVVASQKPFLQEELKVLQELASNLGFGLKTIRNNKAKINILETNLLLTKILDNTNTGMLIVSREGVILYANRKFEELSGYYFSELAGQKINILKSGLHSEDFYSAIWNTLLQNKEWKGEIINKRKDGNLFLTRNYILPVTNSQSEITHFIQIVEDITLEKFYLDQIEKSKFYDPLTKLPNRTYFIEKINQEIYRNLPFYVIYMDIDGFSKISQKVGFLATDKFLQTFANQLQKYIEGYAKFNIFLARLGNDEFGILIEKISTEECIQFLEELLKFTRKLYRFQDNEFYITFSMGVAVYPHHAKTTEELLKFAELALHRARKEKGIGNYAFISRQIEEEFLETMKIETQLYKQVSNIRTKMSNVFSSNFYVVFQPVVNLKTLEIHSLEALLRWEDRDMGKIPPSKFIGLAEKSKLIIPLGEFVLEEVIKQIISWQDRGIKPVPVAVNVSYTQIEDKNFIKFIRDMFSFYRIDPALIEIEITENVVLQNEDYVRKIIHELKDMNMNILLDDFGSGYSSLNYLLKFPFDAIKIDQFFTQKILDGGSSVKLIRAIVQIARSLNLYCIAEGIETDLQKEILQKEGCDFGQGFLFSKPVTSYEVQNMLRGVTV